MPFSVSYEARLQVDHLSPVERGELERLFSSAQPASIKVVRIGAEPHFVSQLGVKHVLWRRGNGGVPEVVSVLDRSYAA